VRTVEPARHHGGDSGGERVDRGQGADADPWHSGGVGDADEVRHVAGDEVALNCAGPVLADEPIYRRLRLARILKDRNRHRDDPTDPHGLEVVD